MRGAAFRRVQGGHLDVDLDGEDWCLPGLEKDHPLTDRVNARRKHSYAESTKATITSQCRKFLVFLASIGLLGHLWHGHRGRLPDVTPMTMVFFVEYCVSTGQKSAGGIANYASAVRQWMLRLGRADPMIDLETGAPSIRYTNYMRAVKRALRGAILERGPMPLGGLYNMIDAVRSLLYLDWLQALNFEAALAQSFWAMLRISEYTSKDGDHRVDWHASRGDIEFFPSQANPEGYRLTIHVSKTQQFDRCVHIITVCRSGVDHRCPVMAMKRLFDQDPQLPTASLFNFNKEGKKRSQKRSTYLAKFNTLLRAVGLPTGQIKSHSMRSGGATAYLQVGVSPYIIQKMGRWQGFSFTIYTWASLDHLKTASRLLAKGNTTNNPVDMRLIRGGK